MGADLIGYLVVGPSTLDETKKDAVIALFDLWVEKTKGLDEGDDPDLANIEMPDGRILSLDDLMDTTTVLGHWRDGADFAENLWTWWVRGSRDCASREMPGDKGRCILFAGEMSWGDIPDGWGYRVLDTILHVPGLDELLGVE